MDDPWGSPWASATTDNTLKNDPIPSPPRSFLLSPPPKAFFGGSTNSPAQSPWAEQGGFGEWANPGQPDDAAAAATWMPWAEPRLTPRVDSPGKHSPIAWPSSAATSPGLNPTTRSRASSFFRQPSPEHWATEAQWRDRQEVLSSAPPWDTEKRSHPSDAAKAHVVIHVEEPSTTTGEQADSMKVTALEDTGVGVEVAASCSTENVSGRLTAETVGHESPSRPSSTFSVESSHSLDRQDSPVTSIDEDSSFRPQGLTRKTSRKVSELVGLYDGLTRAASEEPPVPIGSASHLGAENHSNEADVGDWGNATDELSEVSRNSTTSLSSARSSTPKVHVKDEPKPRQSMESDGYKSITAPQSAAIQELTGKFGIIRFEADLNLLDRLFDEFPIPDHGNEDTRGDPSDRIITDTFTTVEERKAWYRISRYGSMRKHNSGDEENYHSVNWQTSQLHADTIRTVRRWMEEDSFPGRPTLGGSKRTSAFNWDSSAAPVGLDKVFARRSLASTPKSGSFAKFGHTPTSSIGSLGSVLEERKSFQMPITSIASSSTPSVSASPIPSFGWSSIPPPTHVKTASRPTHAIEPSTVADGSTAEFSVLPVPATQISQKQSISWRGTEDVDEDDDWGEMVISPVQEAFRAPSNSPTHQDTAPKTLTTTLKPQDALQIQENPPGDWQSSARNYQSFQAADLDLSGHTANSVLTTSTGSVEFSADPWPSTDLSSFEALATAVEPIPAVSSTVLPSSTPQVRTVLAPNTRHSSSSTVPPPPATNVTLGPIESRKGAGEDDLVKQILRNLPDLAYMLR